MEFGGFIGGFGKIFFMKGRIKREKGGFIGWRGREGGERIYIFLKIFKGVGKNLKFCRGMYFLDYGVGDFWVMYGKERYTKYIVIKVNYNNVN